jgi:hypothetical protein
MKTEAITCRGEVRRLVSDFASFCAARYGKVLSSEEVRGLVAQVTAVLDGTNREFPNAETEKSMLADAFECIERPMTTAMAECGHHVVALLDRVRQMERATLVHKNISSVDHGLDRHDEMPAMQNELR